MMATEVLPQSSLDIETDLLIAQLLEEDLATMKNGKAAERLQLGLVLSDDPNISQPHSQKVDNEPDTDQDVAIQVLAESARVTADAALARSLRDSFDVASYQLAQKLAAAEKKIMLDAEFARRLQAAVDSGEADTDAPEMQDADRVLGPEIISSILARDMNDKGKGKVAQTASSSSTKVFNMFSPSPALSKKLEMLSESKGKSKAPDEPLPEYSKSNPYPMCDICFEPFQVTNSPVSAALTANSSAKLQFGLRLPCPGQHPYCMPCLAEYIKGKLDPSGTGDMSTHTLVFPIRCPGCPITHWEIGIQDDVAVKVLDGESMSIWHHRKLLDSLPRQYCPNPKCSVLVQIDDDPEDPKAQCPACFQWVCVSCKAMWHKDMNCEQYQSLPTDERSPEDQLAIELAKAKQWRRCPGCHAIVELTQGCNHITCLCRKEFCFKCGSLWDTKRQRCTSNPPCDLWEEMMLLDTREREREAIANRVPQPAPRPAQEARGPNFFGGGLFQPPAPEPPRREPLRPVANLYEGFFVREAGRFQRPAPEPPRREPSPDPNLIDWADEVVFGGDVGGDFDWIDDPSVASLVHPFTREMITTLTCGYCNSRLNSINDLRYHLSNVRYHSVFSCCGRFFKRQIDLDRHRDAKSIHNYEVIRNA